MGWWIVKALSRTAKNAPVPLALEYETNTPYASAKSDDDAEAAPSNNTLILLLTGSILGVIE